MGVSGHTEATKAKLSAMRKGPKNPFYGKKHTPEFRRKQSERSKVLNANRQYEIEPSVVPDFEDWRAAYIAGIIDGEGSITMPKGQKGVAIMVANTNEDLMEWLKYNVGGNYRRNTHPTRVERKPCHNWTLYGVRSVASLIIQIRKYLLIKGPRADEAMAFLNKKYGDRLWDK